MSEPAKPAPSASAAEFQPHVPASANVAELTVKAVVLGAVFAVIFGAASVYLALKAGLTVSASIPIAVLSIAVFKKLGKSTILENNMVQTIGSAGESIAAGVVFTLPGFLFLSRDVTTGRSVGVSAMKRKIRCSSAYANAKPSPWNAVRASTPPFSPAISTDAHAVPSG